MYWFKKHDRIYLRWASIGTYWLLAAVLFWLAARSPLGSLPNWPYKSPIDWWLKYLGFVCLLLGFRANQSALMTAHFIFAAVAMVLPLFFAWGFVVMHVIFTLVFLALSVIGIALKGEGVSLRGMLGLFPVHVRNSADVIVICTLLLRVVFDQKRRYVEVLPRTEKKIAIVLTLLGGLFGMHRVYYGRYKSGILYALTLGCLGIGTLRDLIALIQTGSLDAHPLRA